MMTKNYSICTISHDARLIDALRELTDAARTSAFPAEAAVVKGDILVGSLTDGDIRRFLFQNPILSLSETLVSQVMNVEPFAVFEAKLDEKSSLLANVNRNFNAVFIIDAEGRFLYAVPREDEEISHFENTQSLETVVLGLGFVGLTLAIHIADAGFDVVGVDISETHINQLTKFNAPFFEAGLRQKLEQHVGQGLKLTQRLEPSSRPRVFIIAVGTPIVDGNPHNAHLISAVYNIASHLKKGDLVVVRSTVKVQTSEKEILPILERETGFECGRDFYFCMAPERTVEGLALQELNHLPQLLGAPDTTSLTYATKYFEQFFTNIIPLAGLVEAEFAKLLCNSWRDISFAFANEFATASEDYSIDAGTLIKKCNLGYERAQIPLPSPGVGGYCLTKDPFLYAASIQSSLAIKEKSPLSLFGRGINDIAAKSPDRALQKFWAKSEKEPSQLTVLVVGLAFKGKPDTDDLRSSTSLEFVQRITAQGFRVICADAVVKDEVLKSMCDNVLPLSKPVPEEVDAIFILNNHNDNQFLLLDHWIESDKPKLFFDGWNLVGHLEGLMITKNIDFKKMGIV